MFIGTKGLAGVQWQQLMQGLGWRVRFRGVVRLSCGREERERREKGRAAEGEGPSNGKDRSKVGGKSVRAGRRGARARREEATCDGTCKGRGYRGGMYLFVGGRSVRGGSEEEERESGERGSYLRPDCSVRHEPRVT